MEVSIRPLESVLPGGEGSPGLLHGLMRACWLLEAACQCWVPKAGLACRMDAWEGSAQLPWDLHGAAVLKEKHRRGPRHL